MYVLSNTMTCISVRLIDWFYIFALNKFEGDLVTYLLLVKEAKVCT